MVSDGHVVSAIRPLDTPNATLQTAGLSAQIAERFGVAFDEEIPCHAPVTLQMPPPAFVSLLHHYILIC